MGTNTTTSYLDPPQLIGRPNADGTISLTPLELKRLNDYNYYVAKMLQGGLNLANLNKATNEVFTGMVTFTDLETGGSTTINGDNITTGTISADRVSGGTLEGVQIISSEGTNLPVVTLDNGHIIFEVDNGGVKGSMSYETVTDRILIVSYDGVPIKLLSSSNMSIDSITKTYIGTNASYSGDVDIGHAGGTINLVGTVNVNGVPI